MYAVFGFASRDFSLSPHPAKSNAAKTIRNDRVLIRRKSERNKLSSRNRQATWCPVPEIAGILPEVSWLFFKAVRLGPPCRRPILIATIYLLFRGQDTRANYNLLRKRTLT